LGRCITLISTVTSCFSPLRKGCPLGLGIYPTHVEGKVSVPYVRDVRWDSTLSTQNGTQVSVPYVRDVRWDRRHLGLYQEKCFSPLRKGCPLGLMRISQIKRISFSPLRKGCPLGHFLLPLSLQPYRFSPLRKGCPLGPTNTEEQG